jgi:hypothetical protein
MGNKTFLKIFTYFLCVALFDLMGGFSTVLAGSRGKNLPIGEMVSMGEVKFEAREKVWKDVEPSHFPVFQGVKIKTGKGTAVISLPNHHQVEVAQNSILSFEKDRLYLFQGRVDFRISPRADLSLKVGNLTVIKTLSLQAAQSPGLFSPKGEEAIGSLSIHLNGSVTVKSTQGQLAVMNQDRKVMAALSGKDTLTLPSLLVQKPGGEKISPVMIAQAGDDDVPKPSDDRWVETVEEGKYLGLTAKTWGVIGLAALGAGGIVALAAGGGGGGGGGPVCP